MGRHSDSDSDSDNSSSDSSHRPSKRSKHSRAHKSSKESKKKKTEKDRKKESKKDRKKDSKKKKSSSSRKKDRKRRRSRSRSRSDSESSTDDDSSRSSSRSRSRSPKRSSSSSARPTSSSSPSTSSDSIPSPGPASITRCLGLIDTLLQHGGGDRATSLREVQFLLFKLDSGSSVVVESIGDPLVRHILSTMFRELGLKIRQDPVSLEQGWMTPVTRKGRVGYKLLELLKDAFKTPEEIAAEAAAASASHSIVGPIGPSMPPQLSSSSSSSVDGDTLTDPSTSGGPRVLGPAMPKPEDFELLATMDEPTNDAPSADANEDDDDGANYGPKMPSQMTPQELAAFHRLRESREQLAALKSSSHSTTRRDGREEWMTALPTMSSGLPSTSALADILAAGDKAAMKGRGFSNKTVITHEQDEDWALSPAEKERKQQERLAIKQAEQAVYESSRSLGDSSQSFGLASRVSANSSAAAAQAANDRMMARYKQQQVITSESMAAIHAREVEAAKKKALTSKDELFRWDHATEMGMRQVKGAAAIKKEIASAFALNDNFAPAAGK